MGIVKCVVPGCEDRTSPRHRIPVLDEELYEEWLRRIGNQELMKLDPEFVGSHKRICSIHFSSYCRVPNSTKLKKRSLPTHHLPGFNLSPDVENCILRYTCKYEGPEVRTAKTDGQANRENSILDKNASHSQISETLPPDLKDLNDLVEFSVDQLLPELVNVHTQDFEAKDVKSNAIDVASKSGSNELTTKGENVNCSYNFTVLGITRRRQIRQDNFDISVFRLNSLKGIVECGAEDSFILPYNLDFTYLAKISSSDEAGLPPQNGLDEFYRSLMNESHV
ncbi:Hypothetical protein NTJ_12391 [Nesidiocoris tenuis]|uniref:THAP-type domain-containing protein n=1 Tax=Nesidiocoris tenuis TaxID=355587 RepID=A0ABN7B6U2_9HEMI|nr:Hypothetical protein NTJ_12391 [Nesidiocoris tenuis]